MSTAELIRHKIEQIPPGQPFTPAAFLAIGERSTVDKTLTRMVHSGSLIKPTRGVFLRPKKSKFGTLPPEPLEVAIAKVPGALVQIHGAEALRRFGLSTQVPVRPVFYTTGRSRTFKVGKIPVRLQHVSPRKLAFPNTNIGTAISAMWYLGREQMNHKVIKTIKSKLSPEEYESLKAAAPKMPSWMADALHKYEKAKLHA
jgi:Family of unknown function (DUF6088)